MTPGLVCGCNPGFFFLPTILIVCKQTQTFPSRCNFRGKEKRPRGRLAQNHYLIKGHYQSLVCEEPAFSQGLTLPWLGAEMFF